MDSYMKEALFNFLNDPATRAEILIPGYKEDLKKIIDQVISSAKKRFNYSRMVDSFEKSGFKNANDIADYFVRAVVIEFGISLDHESGFDNCEYRLNEINFPFRREELKQVCDQLLPVLRKELGAIQKLHYLSRDLTPIEEMINKIRKEIEIETDDLGTIL